MPAKLKDVTAWLDGELEIDRFADSSANGLQVEGRAEVRRVGLAVDACARSFRAAADAKCDLLVVHHGLIWNEGIRAVRGIMRQRLAILFGHDISLYAAHLPLDAHPRLGNNAGLAKVLGLAKCRAFYKYRDREIGTICELKRPATAAGLAARAAKALSTQTRVVGDAGKRLKRIGVVSGGGSSAISETAAAGLDALFTGEGTYAAEVEARETGVVMIYAGHYETETLGVKAVGASLAKRFRVKADFLDVSP